MTVREGVFDGAYIASAVAPPCRSFEVTNNLVNLLTRHDGTDREDEFLGDTSLLGKDVADMRAQQ